MFLFYFFHVVSSGKLRRQTRSKIQKCGTLKKFCLFSSQFGVFFSVNHKIVEKQWKKYWEFLLRHKNCVLGYQAACLQPIQHSQVDSLEFWGLVYSSSTSFFLVNSECQYNNTTTYLYQERMLSHCSGVFLTDFFSFNYF